MIIQPLLLFSPVFFYPKMQYKEVLRTPGLFFSVLSHDVRDYFLNFLLPRKGRVEQPLGPGRLVANLRVPNYSSVVDFRCTPRGEFLVTIYPITVLRLSNCFNVIAETRFPSLASPMQALETQTGQIVGLIRFSDDIVRENERWLAGSCDQKITAKEARLYKLTRRTHTIQMFDLPACKAVREFDVVYEPDSFAVLSDGTVVVSTCVLECAVYFYSTSGEELHRQDMHRDFSTGCMMTLDAADVVFCTFYAADSVLFLRRPYTVSGVAVQDMALNGRWRFVAVGLDGSLAVAADTGVIMHYPAAKQQ